MRRLFTGIAFLSRIPVPGVATFDATDVSPRVLERSVLYPTLPSLVAAFPLLAVGGLLTGALLLEVGVKASAAWGVRAWGAHGKFGGITGDMMGANTEVCAVRVFVVPLGLGEG